jgi:hypothetical protein
MVWKATVTPMPLELPIGGIMRVMMTRLYYVLFICSISIF